MDRNRAANGRDTICGRKIREPRKREGNASPGGPIPRHSVKSLFYRQNTQKLPCPVDRFHALG